MDAAGARKVFGGRKARLVITMTDGQEQDDTEAEKKDLQASGVWENYFVKHGKKFKSSLWLAEFGAGEPTVTNLVPETLVWLSGGLDGLDDPFVSPDGTRVSFTDRQHVFVGRLTDGKFEKVEVADMGFNPRWWRHPATGDEYVLYYKPRKGTWSQKLEKGGCKPVGAPTKLSKYELEGGRSVDGRYGVTSSGALLEFMPDAVENADIKVVSCGPKECNYAIYPGKDHPDWFSWFRSGHTIAYYIPEKQKGVNGNEKEADEFIPMPKGSGTGSQHLEWATDPEFMTVDSMGHLQVYRWSTKEWTKMVASAKGSNLNGHLWVEAAAK
jgi:hypothetical protein